MISVPRTTIDWTPYNEDVTDYYINQDHTIQETIDYLEAKHGLKATQKQFKSKFGGLKKIRAEEWREIIPRVQKRALEGKETQIFLHDTALDPKRVKREIHRYSSSIDHDVEVTACSNTSAAVGPHSGIRIVTPPPASDAPSVAIMSSLLIHGVDESQDNSDSVPLTSDVPFSPIVLSPSIFLQEMFDKNERVTYQPLLQLQNDNTGPLSIAESAESISNELQEEIPAGADNIFDVSEWINLSSPVSPSSRSSSILCQHNSIRSLELELPWFTLVDDLYRKSLLSSPLLSPVPPHRQSHNGSTTAVLPTEYQTLLGGLLGLSNNRETTGTSFISEVQKYLPDMAGAELIRLAQTQSLESLFALTAYLVSNNQITEAQQDSFIEWLVKEKHTAAFKRFLKINTPSVQVFASKALAAVIRCNKLELSKQIYEAGVPFDGVIETALGLDNAECLNFVLDNCDPAILKGQSGGRLLRCIARTKHVDIAKRLIQAGAIINIDLSEEDGIVSTALYEACVRSTSKSTSEMVDLLVRNGAKVNQLCLSWPPTCLGAAVRCYNGNTVKYLLDHGANVRQRMYRSTILEYVDKHWTKMSDTFLNYDKQGSISIHDIVAAANRSEGAWSSFMQHNDNIPGITLEMALHSAIRSEKVTSFIHLLQYGVDPNTSQLGDARPIITAQTETSNPERYMDLLIHFHAYINVDGIVDALFHQGAFSLPVLEKLLDSGLNVQMYGPDILSHAVYWDAEEAIFAVLDYRSIDSIDSYSSKFTVLQAAARNGKIDLVRRLVDRGADIHKPAFPVEGLTSIQAAAHARSLELMEYLIRLGADINSAPAVSGGMTTLEATVRPRHFPFIHEMDLHDLEYDDDYDCPEESFLFLLGRGAQVNRPGNSNSPLLHDIIERRQPKILRHALKAGAKVDHLWRTVSSSWSLRTPLQLAAEMGELDFVGILLEYGSDPNAPAAHSQGRTALQAAASSTAPNIEIVQLLLWKGADVNACPAVDSGITALQGAALRGHINIAWLLIQNGAEVNAMPALKNGRTAIECAAEHGRLDMVYLLLKFGAIGGGIGSGFAQASRLARKNGHVELAALLESQQTK